MKRPQKGSKSKKRKTYKDREHPHVEESKSEKRLARRQESYDEDMRKLSSKGRSTKGYRKPGSQKIKW
jgi:hypothetical protein